MGFTFQNQGTNTYLVYEIGASDELDTMSLGMLTNNAIAGFAPTIFTQMDTTRYIKYNVSAKVSASQLFSGIVNKKRLVGVLLGIANAMLSAEDYMIESNSILLDLDYIFVDVSSCETIVVCLPLLNRAAENLDMGLFIKNIVFNTQFDQTENCGYVAQILNYLNSSPTLSLADFKNLLEEITKGKEPLKQAQPSVAPESTRATTVEPVVKEASATSAATTPKAAADVPPVRVQPKHENLQFGPNYSPTGKSADPVRPERVEKDIAQKEPESGEEKMSFLYLLQHYNKENAAIYKSQQEAKKTKKPASPMPAQQPTPKKAEPKSINVGFAIPGMQESAAPSGEPKVQQESSAPVRPSTEYKARQQVVKQEIPQPVVQPPVQQPVTPINFGETTVLGGTIGETTVLGGIAEPGRTDPHLIRMKNDEKIPLNKPVFRIGKERSYVDYFIGDNTAISRSHANIINRNGEFFVVDTNSTNHTYVNGGMIQSNVETRLSHGAKIRFANEDFEFRLY